MSTLRALAATWLVSGRRAVVVEVTRALGSTPRGEGTRMLVTATQSAGTVGGGHLELQAIAVARGLLDAADAAPRSKHFPLGPALGQCCGGAVTLSFAPLDADALARWPVEPPLFRLQLHGAGHVGRAIARALAPLPVEVDWIDEREAEFPRDFGEPGSAWPEHIRRVCVDGVEAEVDAAQPGTLFLVLTHRHDLDLRIAEAILRRTETPRYFGMIGSRTKRERFVHRFEALGVAPERIARMTCPIGLPGIAGKEPALIAVAVVAQLVIAAGSGAEPGVTAAPNPGVVARRSTTR